MMDSSPRHVQQEYEQPFFAVWEVAPDAMVILAPDGTVIAANPAFFRLHGYRPEEIIGQMFSKLLPAEQRQRAQEGYAAAFARPVITSPFEQAIVRADGSKRFVEVCSIFIGEQGARTAMLSTLRDVTERKKTEEFLRARGQFSQAVLDALTATIAVIDQDGTIQAVNQAWKRFAQENSEGRDVASTGVGVNYLEVCRKAQGLFAEEAPRALVGIQRVLQGEQAHFLLEYPCHSPTEHRWFLVSVTPLEQSQGAVVAHLNITERKLAEEIVQRSEARVRRLIESNILGIFFWRGRQITEANEVFLSMLGYTRQELLTGKLLWNDMTPKKFEELDREAMATMRRLGALAVPYEKEFFRKDGSRVPVLIGAAVVDEVQHEGVAFVLDISERKELERRKDDFFGMVSHELKTPLSNMWILTSLLTKQLTEQGFRDPSGNLVQLGTQAKQLIKLMTDVLEVSQLQEGYLLYAEELFDMNALLREVVSTLQQVSPDHAIVIDGTADKPMLGDRARLGQVLSNLLTNAIKYSARADPIDVLLSSTDELLTIRVRDYGIGIPSEQKGMIFERFYRVQYGKQGGFGLGLYISQEIVKRHGGTIEVESVEGKGSTFTLLLPLRT